MIIKGLENMIRHMESQHKKNIEEWYAHRGLPPFMEKAVRREHRRRHFDDVDYGNHEDWQDHPDAVFGFRY